MPLINPFFSLFPSVHVGSGDQHCESKSLLCPVSGRSNRNNDPFEEDQLLVLHEKLLLYIRRCSGDRCTWFFTHYNMANKLREEVGGFQMAKMFFRSLLVFCICLLYIIIQYLSAVLFVHAS